MMSVAVELLANNRGCVSVGVDLFFLLELLEGSGWCGWLKRGDYCLNGTLFLALSQKRAILVAFNIAKRSNNALREPLSTKQLIIVNGACLDC